jgi:hypothetical protein
MYVLLTTSPNSAVAGREPGDQLSVELQRYARIEGLTAADLRPQRPERQSKGRSTAAAVRDWVAGLRRPKRLVPGAQH